MSNGEEERDIKQIRREGRLRKRRQQVKKHGGSIARIYRDAVTKRVRQKEGGEK